MLRHKDSLGSESAQRHHWFYASSEFTHNIWFESVESQVFYTEFYLLSISLNKQSLKLDNMRKEDGIISPCLVCFHEGSDQKEKMSHSASFPIWWFGLRPMTTKRGQHSMAFDFTGSKTPQFLIELFFLSKAHHPVFMTDRDEWGLAVNVQVPGKKRA